MGGDGGGTAPGKRGRSRAGAPRRWLCWAGLCVGPPCLACPLASGCGWTRASRSSLVTSPRLLAAPLLGTRAAPDEHGLLDPHRAWKTPATWRSAGWLQEWPFHSRGAGCGLSALPFSRRARTALRHPAKAMAAAPTHQLGVARQRSPQRQTRSARPTWQLAACGRGCGAWLRGSR